MILTNNGYVICTPTKVVSTAIEQIICKSLKVGRKITQEEAMCGLPGDYPHGKAYQHGAEYIEGSAKRLLLIRHPLERWSSIYWATKKGKWPLTKYTHDINIYAEKWFEVRDKDPFKIQVMSLLDYYKIFRPHKVFKLEDGFDKLLTYMKLPIRDSHANASGNIGWAKTSGMIKLPLRKKLILLMEPELEMFKYSTVFHGR